MFGILRNLMLINSVEQSHYWEDDNSSSDQEIIRFYRKRRFIAMSTRTRCCTLFWASWIQSAHLRLGLPSGVA